MKTENNFSLEQVSVRLVKDTPLFSNTEITEPESAVSLLGEFLADFDREVMCVINLKANGAPINFSVVSIGAVSETIAHPRDLLKSAILSNAASMLIIHNHPSNSLVPSRYDTMLTDRMIQVCELIGIPLLDHIIVGSKNNDEYYSFKENGLIITKNVEYHVVPENIQFPKHKASEEGIPLNNGNKKQEAKKISGPKM